MVWIGYSDKKLKQSTIWIDGYMPRAKTLRKLENDHIFRKKTDESKDDKFENLINNQVNMFCKIDKNVNGIFEVFFCHGLRSGSIPYFPSYVYNQIRKNMRSTDYRQIVFTFSNNLYPNGMEIINKIIESSYFQLRSEENFEDFEVFKRSCYGLLKMITEYYANKPIIKDEELYNLAIELIC